jgi:hypothetical protein
VDLSIWQGLSDETIANVLDLPTSAATVRIQRARLNLLMSVTTLLLFADRRQCEALDADLGIDQVVTPLTRRRVVHHLEHCERCRTVSDSAVDVLALAGAPEVAAPTELRASLFGSQTQTSVTGEGSPPESPDEHASGNETQSDALERADSQLRQSPNLSADAGVILYVGQEVRGQDLTFVEQAARLDRQRPAFRADGFPRSHKKKRFKRVPVVITLLLAAIILGMAVLAMSGL